MVRWVVRTCPLPPQVGQVSGKVPFAAPLPPHSPLFYAVVADLLLAAESRLLKGHRKADLQIVSPYGTVPTGAPAPAEAEHGTEQIADIAEIGAEAAEACAAAHAAVFKRGVTHLIVGCTLFGVRKDGVRLVYFLKLRLRVLVPRIHVGMILLRQRPVRFLDLRVARALL